MVWVAGTTAPGGTYGHTGTLQWTRPEPDLGIPTTFRSIDIPDLLSPIEAYGSTVNYRNRLYICSQYSDNAVLDEYLRLHRLGIMPPVQRPVIAPSGTGVTASDVIGYVTFWDEKCQERSSLSGASNTLAVSNDGFLWTNLPEFSDDPRVTHIELWRSVDGGLPRLAVRRQLGVTTVTENVATLALGEAMVTTFERFPRCKYNAIYHDRHVLAGDPDNPGTIYLSGIFLPERFEGLSFKTRNGEPVIGLINVRDVLLILCPESSYLLQGYSENDMVLALSEPELGAISHYQLDLVHGNAMIPNRKSVYLFNGAWHNVLVDGQYEWRKALQTYPEAFELGFGRHDPVSNRYKFLVDIPNTPHEDIFLPVEHPTIHSLYWTADLNPILPELAGSMSQPNWSFDVRARKDSVMARLSRPGFQKTEFYTGSCDGKIRQENFDDDDGDDGDAYGKRWSVRTAAVLMQNPGGDIEEGKSFPRTWVYLESEGHFWDLYLFGGDEEAWQQQRIQNVTYDNEVLRFKATSEPGETTAEGGGFIWSSTPKTVWPFVTEGVSGRALTALVTASPAADMKFRGLGGWWGPGPATRPARQADPISLARPALVE